MSVSEISDLVLCRRCLGKTGVLDPECARCGGIESATWGVDPVSLCGCVQGDDPDLDCAHGD